MYYFFVCCLVSFLSLLSPLSFTLAFLIIFISNFFCFLLLFSLLRIIILFVYYTSYSSICFSVFVFSSPSNKQENRE